MSQEQRSEATKYVRVYKGVQDNIRVIVVRAPQIEKNAALLLFKNIDHPWDGCTIAHERIPTSSDKVEYKTKIEEEDWITMTGKKVGERWQYGVCLPGMTDEIPINYAEKETKEIDHQEIIDQYLKQQAAHEKAAQASKDSAPKAPANTDKPAAEAKPVAEVQTSKPAPEPVKEQEIPKKAPTPPAPAKAVEASTPPVVTSVAGKCQIKIEPELRPAMLTVEDKSSEFIVRPVGKIEFEQKSAKEENYFKQYFHLPLMAGNRGSFPNAFIDIKVLFGIEGKWVAGTLVRNEGLPIPINLPAGSAVSFTIVASLLIQGIPGNDVQSCSMLHPSLPSPFRIRLEFEPLRGDTVIRELEYQNR